MVRMRRIIGALMLVIIGAVFGPALFYAFADLRGERSKWDELFLGQKLVEAYDRHNPPDNRILHSMAMPETDTSCGYTYLLLFKGHQINPRIVLNPKLTAEWTPETGYQDLTSWSRGQREDLTHFARGRVLASNLSFYSMRVLDDCIEHTALSSICVAYVRRVLTPSGFANAYEVRSDVDMTRENKTICTYMDGIAARSGQPLARR